MYIVFQVNKIDQYFALNTRESIGINKSERLGNSFIFNTNFSSFSNKWPPPQCRDRWAPVYIPRLCFCLERNPVTGINLTKHKNPRHVLSNIVLRWAFVSIYKCTCIMDWGLHLVRLLLKYGWFSQLAELRQYFNNPSAIICIQPWSLLDFKTGRDHITIYIMYTMNKLPWLKKCDYQDEILKGNHSAPDFIIVPSQALFSI